MSDELQEEEHELSPARRSMTERVAILEQWMRSHTQLANQRFNRNDEAHSHLTQMLEKIAAEIDMLGDRLSRYDWLARGVMLTLFAIGMAGGWIIERWHTFVGWIKP